LAAAGTHRAFLQAIGQEPSSGDEDKK
jgi:hypothetical protein